MSAGPGLLPEIIVNGRAAMQHKRACGAACSAAVIAVVYINDILLPDTHHFLFFLKSRQHSWKNDVDNITPATIM